MHGAKLTLLCTCGVKSSGIALALMPRMNHFWYVALQIRSRGLSTLLLPHDNRMFTMTFDFVTHDLVIQSSDGATEKIPLEPRSVKAFYEIVTRPAGGTVPFVTAKEARITSPVSCIREQVSPMFSDRPIRP